MNGPTANPFDLHYPEVAQALRAWSVLRTRGVLGRFLEADDLVQEVCFQAYRSVSGYDAERGSFRRWLFGVASHVAADLLRRAAGPMHAASAVTCWAVARVACPKTRPR